jgi:hypothetical protein
LEHNWRAEIPFPSTDISIHPFANRQQTKRGTVHYHLLTYIYLWNWMLLVDNALRHSIQPTVSRRLVSSTNCTLSVKMITTLWLTDTTHTHTHTHTHIVRHCAAICTGRWRSCIICNCSSSTQSVKRITTISTPPTDNFSPSNAKKFIAFQINISVCKIVQSLSRHAYQSESESSSEI